MRRLQFHTDKGKVKGTAKGSVGMTVKKTAAVAAIAVLLALQVAGCSQAGGQEKEAQAAETSSTASGKAGNVSDAGTAGTQAEGGAGTGKIQDAKAVGGAGGQDSSKAGDAGEGDAGIEFKPGMPIKEGIMAPDFTAELVDGTSLTLSELQGKPVIINFWATWCPPCVKEMPAFERLKEDFGDEIGIIAVNCGDDEDTVKDFAEENGYTFPIALDEEYEISMLYPTSSIPYTVVLDGDGKVTHISAGAADADTMYERYKEALGV